MTITRELMTNNINAGSEVDSYCTKCKLDLNHRIIAMVGDTIKRVECLTCGGHHNYRKPKSEKEKAKKRSTTAAGAKRASTVSKSQQRQHWEKAIAGKGPDDFIAYNMSLQLAVGQLVRHKKFGDGVVSELLEDNKAQLLFESGPKILVYGR